MEIELLNQDIQNYLNKYTRFMSKKVYITKKMYDNFVDSYEYIYRCAKESIINYNNDKYYKKLLDIKDRGLYALKLHNKKYLDYLYDKYQDKLSNKLSKKEKLSILCEEDVVMMEVKNIDNKIEIVREKVSYLKNYCNVKSNNICIIVNDDIKDRLLDVDVDIFNYKDLGNKICNNEKIIISEEDRYQILSSYIKDIMYLDKNKFNNFYKVFRDKLYFNEDVLDFETFRDYHSYMFKRNLMSSKRSISESVKDYIVNRRKELRSVSGEVFDNGILVDICNTLFCSGVDYVYDRSNNNFIIRNDDISYRVYYIDSDAFDNKKSDDIYLYAKYKDGTNACEHLIYELVKRRYPIEKKIYEELYDILKLDEIDSYFKDFINYIVIPYIDMINKNSYSYGDLEDISNNLEGSVKDEYLILLDFYKYYSSYLDENNLIDKISFISNIGKNISNIKYKYLIVLDDICEDILINNINFKLFVLGSKNILSYSYLMSNVKLFCDFKKYLNYEKLIPIIDVYYGNNEIDRIAYDFTKINIDRVCNAYGEMITNKKNIEVYIYDDSKRDNSIINSNYLLNEVISKIDKSKNKKIMIMGRDNRDKNNLILGNYFSFGSKNKIICNDYRNGNIEYVSIDREEIQAYDTGILIHPMDDKYGFRYDYMDEEVIRFLSKDNIVKSDWEKKLFYMAVSRVKNKLYVVVPKSKASLFVKGIANHNEVMVKKEVFSYSDK